MISAAVCELNGRSSTNVRVSGPGHIRGKLLAPGWKLTQKQGCFCVKPDGLQAHLANQGLKDTIGPEEIVAGGLLLALDASRMMTGQALATGTGAVVTGKGNAGS